MPALRPITKRARVELRKIHTYKQNKKQGNTTTTTTNNNNNDNSI
jgi:hypothetical protein